MNYRHAYHAGNFADVFKHIVLTRLIAHLQRKEKAFRVYDTHAGIGLYDLSSEEAGKTGEWLNGIGRLAGQELPAEFMEIAALYLAIIRELNPEFDQGTLTQYPGSPLLIRKLLRKQDRLSACELHPVDAKLLRSQFENDFQTRVLELDGWLAATAHIPPKEKRGLLFIDPPFEDGKDFARIGETLINVHKRWREGMVAFWYPVKDEKKEADFLANVANMELGETLLARFMIAKPGPQAGFVGSGLLIKNPPYTLEGELKAIAPVLCELMGTAEGAVGGVAGEAQLDIQVL